MADSSPAMTTLPPITDSGNISVTVKGSGPSGNPMLIAFMTFPLFNITMDLLSICPAVILSFGTFGNVMTVVVMHRLKSEDSTINMYFSATAVMDMVALCTNIMAYYSVPSYHIVLCKLLTWIYSGSGTISCWYLVCMTVHRAMSIVWPHRVNLLCTRRTVLFVLTAITIFYAGLYSHYLIGYEILTDGRSSQCLMSGADYIYYLKNMAVYIEMVAYCLLPFFVLVCANSVLTWKLVTSVKKAGSDLSHGSSDQVRLREKAANSVTVTVITVSMAFLVLTLPASLNYAINTLAITIHTRRSVADIVQAHFISVVCQLLSLTNHAVNFYLYCLTGRRFREEFIKVMCCGMRR